MYQDEEKVYKSYITSLIDLNEMTALPVKQARPFLNIGIFVALKISLSFELDLE